MEFFIVLILAIFVFGMPTNGDGNINNTIDSDRKPVLGDISLIIKETIKREEGPSAFIPDVSFDGFQDFGVENDCYIDCKEDFPKTFICWYYNNTRCDGCKLTSDDQSCLNLCTCRGIGQRKIVDSAKPVTLSGIENSDHSTTIVTETAVAITSTVTNISGRNSAGDEHAWPFYCGTPNMTDECATAQTFCSDTGLLTDSEACRETCHCLGSNTVRGYIASISGGGDYITKHMPAMPEFWCNYGLTHACRNSTTCDAFEGVKTNDEICRENCFCANSMDTIRSRRPSAPHKERTTYPFICLPHNLAAECATNGTACSTEGITSESTVCLEHCFCRNSGPAIPSFDGLPFKQESSSDRLYCVTREIEQICNHLNTMCTVEGVMSDSPECGEFCYCTPVDHKSGA